MVKFQEFRINSSKSSTKIFNNSRNLSPPFWLYFPNFITWVSGPAPVQPDSSLVYNKSWSPHRGNIQGSTNSRRPNPFRTLPPPSMNPCSMRDLLGALNDFPIEYGNSHSQTGGFTLKSWMHLKMWRIHFG